MIVTIVSVSLVLVGWSVSSPAGSSPDDSYHLASIWCGQGFRDGLCEPGETDTSVLVPAAIPPISCFAFDPTASASSCQVPRDSSDSAELQPTSAFDRGFYPPVYYWSQSFFASSDPYLSSHVVRLVNIALFVLLLSVSWILASQQVRRALALVSIILIAPLGLFMIASTNPSAWAYSALSVFWAVLLTYFESSGARRRNIGIFLLLIAVIGAGSRSDAAVWILLSVIITLVYRPVSEWERTTDIPIAISLAIVLGLSLATSSQGEIGAGGLESTRSISNLDLWFANLGEVVRLILGPLGSSPLGWLDTPMYSITSILATAVVFGVIFNFLVDHSHRENAAIFLATGILILGPLYLLSQGRNLVGEVVQARYFFPWLPIVAGMIVLRTKQPGRGLSWSQGGVLLAVLFLSHAYSLHQHMRRYISGLDVSGINLGNTREWWWSQSAFLSPNLIWITISVLYGIALVGMLIYYRNEKTNDNTIPAHAD